MIFAVCFSTLVILLLFGIWMAVDGCHRVSVKTNDIIFGFWIVGVVTSMYCVVWAAHS